MAPSTTVLSLVIFLSTGNTVSVKKKKKKVDIISPSLKPSVDDDALFAEIIKDLFHILPRLKTKNIGKKTN